MREPDDAPLRPGVPPGTPTRTRSRRRVLGALGRIALQQAIQYRSNFFLNFIVGGTSSIAVLFPLFFVFQDGRDVAGWTFDQAILVTAFFQLYSALVGGLVEPNLGAVVEGVRNGQLDYLLMKPADAQLVATFQRVDPSKVWDLLGGLCIGGVALSRLGLPSPVQALTALVLLASGLVAIYGLWMLVICMSFWFVRVDNLRYLLGAVADAGRWPVDVYHGVARTFLTVIVPVALVTSWPAMAVLGRLSPWQGLQGVLVGAALFAVSRLAWRGALAHYTSASS